MAYVGYALRFRPKTFRELVGQKGVVDTLSNAIATDRVSHAYLFCGPRGTGKTTTARILARALNCEEGPTPEMCDKCASCVANLKGEALDVVEIDAASHRKIEDMRTLREGVWNSTMSGRYRVYIIDEVHMLTTEAFNAFLKVLEEPPPHVKFILATTDPQKMPETVRSRCTRLDFRRLNTLDIVERLAQIVESEELDVSRDALQEIARHSRGGLRDAELLLEQLSIYTTEHITPQHVRELTGATSPARVAELVAALATGDTKSAIEILDALLSAGLEVGEFLDSFVQYLSDALALASCGEDSTVVQNRAMDVEAVKVATNALSSEQLLFAAAVVQNARKEAQFATASEVVAELAIIRLSRINELQSLENIAARLNTAPATGQGLTPSGSTSTRRVTASGVRASAGKNLVAPKRRAETPQRQTTKPAKTEPEYADESPFASSEEEVSPFATAPGPATAPGLERSDESRSEIRRLQPRDTPTPASKPSANKTAPVEAPTGNVGDLTLETATENWGAFQKAVSKASRTTGACLKKGELASVEDGTLQIEFAASGAFQREKLSGEKPLGILAKVAMEVFGCPLGIQLTAASSSSARSSAKPSAKPVAKSAPTPKSAAKKAAPPPSPKTRKAATPKNAKAKSGFAEIAKKPGIKNLLDKTGGYIVQIEDDGK